MSNSSKGSATLSIMKGASEKPKKKKKATMKKSVVDHTYRDYANVAITDLIEDYNGVSDELFPGKLHSIVSNPEYSHIISWRPHGRAWVVHSRSLFKEEVLPMHFSHGNFESFNRSVNGWGFKRLLSDGPDQNSYYHELFLRNRPDLTSAMTRLVSPGKRLPNKAGEPNFYEISKRYPLPGPPAPVAYPFEAEEESRTAPYSPITTPSPTKRARKSPPERTITTQERSTTTAAAAATTTTTHHPTTYEHYDPHQHSDVPITPYHQPGVPHPPYYSQPRHHPETHPSPYITMAPPYSEPPRYHPPAPYGPYYHQMQPSHPSQYPGQFYHHPYPYHSPAPTREPVVPQSGLASAPPVGPYPQFQQHDPWARPPQGWHHQAPPHHYPFHPPPTHAATQQPRSGEKYDPEKMLPLVHTNQTAYFARGPGYTAPQDDSSVGAATADRNNYETKPPAAAASATQDVLHSERHDYHHATDEDILNNPLPFDRSPPGFMEGLELHSATMKTWQYNDKNHEEGEGLFDEARVPVSSEQYVMSHAGAYTTNEVNVHHQEHQTVKEEEEEHNPLDIDNFPPPPRPRR